VSSWLGLQKTEPRSKNGVKRGGRGRGGGGGENRGLTCNKLTGEMRMDSPSSLARFSLSPSERPSYQIVYRRPQGEGKKGEGGKGEKKKEKGKEAPPCRSARRLLMIKKEKPAEKRGEKKRKQGNKPGTVVHNLKTNQFVILQGKGGGRGKPRHLQENTEGERGGGEGRIRP